MASVAFIGLIVLSNSLYVSNYIFIRSERKLADAKSRVPAAAAAEKDESSSENAVSTPTTTKSATNVPSPMSALPSNDIVDGDDNGDEREVQVEECIGGMYGLCCGRVRKEVNTVRTFINWEHIRYRFGILSTSVLLMLVAYLFSERTLHTFGADPSGGSRAGSVPQLCKSDDRSEHIFDVRQVLKDATNIDSARRQYDHTVRFYRALINDTDLYGTSGYECPMYPRTKEEYQLLVSDEYGYGADYDGDGYGNDTLQQQFGFFPGHCAAAQEMALQSERGRTCVETVCVDDVVEVDVAVVNQDTSKVKGAWDYIKDGADGLVEVVTVQKPIRGCKDVTIPCPDHEAADNMDESLRQYRWEQTKRFQEMLEEGQDDVVEKIESIASDERKEAGRNVILMLVRQVDIASTLYVAYVCVSLLFPSPVYIFRSNYSVLVARYSFGAQKHVFILAVLVIWWGVRYVRSFRLDLEVQLYLQSLIKDPCYGDSDFLVDATKAVNDICDELLPMKSGWETTSGATRRTLEEVFAFGTSCDCDFPCVNLCDAMADEETSHGTTVEELESIHFGTKVARGGFCSSCEGVDIFVQDSDAIFLGNSTVCDDPGYATEVLFLDLMSDSSYIDGWDLWVRSGLLATLLVKTFIANFGVAVMHLADPLSACAGKFEGPPSRYDLGRGRTLETLRRVCESNLRMIALRRCVFWGGLANVCLLNIMASTFRTDDGRYAVPNSVGTALIVAATGPPLICFLFTRRTSRMVSELNEGMGAAGVPDEGASTDREAESSSSDEEAEGSA